MWVSIPSKRESAFQGHLVKFDSGLLASRFNSLRTGNRISRRRFASRTLTIMSVSIPSERETAFQVEIESNHRRLLSIVSIPSERESAFQGRKRTSLCRQTRVSIPSERESAFQAVTLKVCSTNLIESFQFPPNGKPLFK